MKDIFLSRPSWIPKSCEKGLYNFYNLLNTNGLNPKTLGQSDFLSKSPLEEVINLMKKCHGAIILGIPQIEIIEGKIKEEKINKIELGTEWNHMEAMLAYSTCQPLLIIHHENVHRGIFEKGVCNSYLYKVDMNDPDWPYSKEINGVLLSWKKLINKPNLIKHIIKILLFFRKKIL
jgi:hypothetical protein